MIVKSTKEYFLRKYLTCYDMAEICITLNNNQVLANATTITWAQRITVVRFRVIVALGDVSADNHAGVLLLLLYGITQ